MKKILFFLVIIFLAACGPAATQAPPTLTPIPPTPTVSPTDLVKAYEDAYNRHDVAGVMALFAEEASLSVTSMGFDAPTRQNIQALHEYYGGLNGETHLTDCQASNVTVTCTQSTTDDCARSSGANMIPGKATFTFDQGKIKKVLFDWPADDPAQIKYRAYGEKFNSWYQETYPSEFAKDFQLTRENGTTIGGRCKEYGAISQASKPITQIFAFGDEWTDNGNGYRVLMNEIEKKTIDSSILQYVETRYGGRQSNGPLAVEVMANRLKVKLNDYAYGAATSGYENIITDGELRFTGLLSQVNKFKGDLDGEKADPDALYFIFSSSPDWSQIPSEAPREIYIHTADQVVDNNMKAVETLASFGAKRFMVVSSYDIKITPELRDELSREMAKAYQVEFDAQLPPKMSELAKRLKVEINVFDYLAVSDKIRNNAAEYGITNLSDPCIGKSYSGPTCENPDEYFFWDYLRPTLRVNQIIGEEMAAVYEE